MTINKMKKQFKWFFLLTPIAVWVLLFGVYSYQNSKIKNLMQDADGLILGTANNRFVVRTSRTFEGEVSTDVIIVTDHDGKIVLETVVSMDHDLYGTGFVKAIQADSDSELEVVAWGNNIKQGEPFYLDFVDGTVKQRPFDEISIVVIKIIEDYKQFNTLYPILFGLLLFLTPAYYILYFIIYLIAKASGRKKVQ